MENKFIYIELIDSLKTNVLFNISYIIKVFQYEPTGDFFMRVMGDENGNPQDYQISVETYYELLDKLT